MRVRALTPEQREAVANLTHPSQMPIEERRRQYNALNRRLESAKDLPPGLIEKWNAQDSIGKFLICLSCFITYLPVYAILILDLDIQVPRSLLG